MAETTFYIHLEPQWGRYPYNRDTLTGIKASRITQSRPDKPRGPVVKLVLRLPDAAFKPLAPEVTIDIPEEAIDFTPEVTVELPEVADG